MGVLIGYDMWGSVFTDDSPSIRNINYAEFSGSIIDEILVREKTNQGTENVKDTWNSDTSLLAKFLNNLEAGNISNDGVKIVKFKVIRRDSEQIESNDIKIGEIEFTENQTDFEFLDVTQPNKELTYTIVPVGENGIDGTPRTIECESDFCGVWLVDKDTNEVLAFDKAIGSIGNVDSVLNQNRVQLDTFSQYPQFYYGEQQYESFSLSTTILPDDNKRSGDKFKEILDKFIRNRKPLLVKTDTGRLIVADISNVRSSSPMNTWQGYDYIQLTVDVTETESYENYMEV